MTTRMMDRFSHFNNVIVSVDTLIHVLHKRSSIYIFWHTHSNGVSDGLVYRWFQCFGKESERVGAMGIHWSGCIQDVWERTLDGPRGWF